jgi:hypothetical protein
MLFRKACRSRILLLALLVEKLRLRLSPRAGNVPGKQKRQEEHAMSEHVAQQETTEAVAQQNKGSTFDRFAGGAALLVAVSSVIYGFVYLLLVPADQKGAAPAALTSFYSNPTGRQIASIMLALGGLSTATAAVGIYYRLRDQHPGWAGWSVRIGFAAGLLTALHGIYLTVLLPVTSTLYDNPPGGADASAIKNAVIALAYLPSPLDPGGFSKFCLAGIWLLVTGALMLRSRAFPRWLAYLGLVGGVGLLLLYVGGLTGTTVLILATGLPSSVLVGPLFWVAVGYTLWARKS